MANRGERNKKVLIEFGKRLREARKAKRLTQDSLSKIMGVTRPNVANYESGLTATSVHSLVRLSEVLDVSIDWLLRGDGDRFKKEINYCEHCDFLAVSGASKEFGFCSNPESGVFRKTQLLSDPECPSFKPKQRLKK